MVPKLVRQVLLLLIAAAYVEATVTAAALPIGSCPAVDGAAHSAHHHRSGHGPSHYPNGSGKTAGECLKCCLGACLVAPCLPDPTVGVSELAFVGTPVLYWAVLPAIAGRAIAPDPGPPKPIA